MPTIRPVSDLRNHFSEIESLVNEGSPVYLTKNGRESMVIMNNETYDELVSCNGTNYAWTPQERREIEAKIAEIEKSKKDGTYVTHDGEKFFNNLFKKLESNAKISF